jgi:hypothetical protein
VDARQEVLTLAEAVARWLARRSARSEVSGTFRSRVSRATERLKSNGLVPRDLPIRRGDH